VSGQFQYGMAQSTTSDATPSAASVSTSHFECAVRLGRRKADPFGHLVLTESDLQYRGTRDLDVPWRQVSAVEHMECEIIVSLHNTRRTLHFCCSTRDEAARGTAAARELIAALAHRPAIALV
jgi:hypothetical protein